MITSCKTAGRTVSPGDRTVLDLRGSIAAARFGLRPHHGAPEPFALLVSGAATAAGVPVPAFLVTGWTGAEPVMSLAALCVECRTLPGYMLHRKGKVERIHRRPARCCTASRPLASAASAAGRRRAHDRQGRRAGGPGVCRVHPEPPQAARSPRGREHLQRRRGDRALILPWWGGPSRQARPPHQHKEGRKSKV